MAYIADMEFEWDEAEATLALRSEGLILLMF